MFSLGIVTARGGSKRLPGKHLRLLCGKPMIQYTLEAAKGSALDAYLVSTDDPAIAKFCSHWGAPVPFLRPPELASDSAKSVDVLLHALRWFEDRFRIEPTHVVLLQPTSPLRRLDEINHGLMMMDLFPRHDSFVSMGTDEEPNGCLYITKRDMLVMDRRIWDLSGIMWIQPYPMTDVDTFEDLLEAERHLCQRSR